MCLRERVTERRKTWVKDNIRVHAHIRAEREREREREREKRGVSELLYLTFSISGSVSQALSLFFWNSWHHRSVVMCPVCLSVCLSLSQSLSLPLFIYMYIYSLAPSLSFSVSLPLPFSLSLFLYFSLCLPPSHTVSLWLRDDEVEIIMYY